MIHTTTTPVARNQQRDHYVPLIKAILERGPASRGEICAELDLNENTASIYLRHMHRDLGMIKRGPLARNNSFKWELGEDTTRDSEVEKGEQRTVPACQVGMWRDTLVAALFGPAGVHAQEVPA